MKKLTILIMLLLVGLTAWSQIDLSVDSLSQIDFDEIDTSNAEVYFQGPVDFYVSGIRYAGQSYAAILKFDGVDSFIVKAPAVTTKENKPFAVDLSKTDIIAPETANGVISLDDVVLNGWLSALDIYLDVEETLAQQEVVLKVAGKVAFKSKDKTHPDSIAKTAAELMDKNKQITEMLAQIEVLQADVASLEAKYAQAGTMAMGLPDMSSAAYIAIPATSAKMFGSWAQTAKGLDMTDSKAAYAKVSGALKQSANEYLYSATVDANSKQGWIGAGVHILAGNVKALDRYGLGASYLVWLTKDARLQTDATFVQLYQSTSDGRMFMLASEKISGDINSANDVSVYVNKTSDTILVSVNGEVLISYASDTDLPSGDIVALRAAGGPVSFTNLSVQAK